MVSHTTTAAFTGLKVTPVDVQVQLSSGMPKFVMVGLPDKAVAESRERVRSAMTAIGLALPAKRIVVNLSPADLAKEGSHFDLPIALSLLKAMDVIPNDPEQDFWALGELGLDGRILPVRGILPTAIAALSQGSGLVCPANNGAEAAWAGEELDILAPQSLLELINHFQNKQLLTRPEICTDSTPPRYPDFAEVKGQSIAKRALEIAAAGGHNVLMSGPPGAGKSMLARCIPGILPPLDVEEILEVSMIASIAGMLAHNTLNTARPYRDPHHTSSNAAMVGGGRLAKPGEISLAHRGILFLDELPEFGGAVLESLRQPLEDGVISVARAAAHVTYPANFQLIAAMNPCRCGYLGDASRSCNRAPLCGADYQRKLSGPLLDRFDIFIEVPPLDTVAMLDMPVGEPTAQIAARVQRATMRQRTRYKALSSDRTPTNRTVRTNADASGDTLSNESLIDEAALALLKRAVSQMQLSMRGYTRMLRVARTIADLEGSELTTTAHMSEALGYRGWSAGAVAKAS